MKIAVCCSSSNEISREYLETSKSTLEKVFERDNDLVFGAMDSGIMGVAYRVAKRNNRKVTGIAPEIYKDDFLSLECDEEILTKDVSDRTNALINNSDVLMFFPGGVGTIYELMAAIEGKRSGEFDKPIIICNNTRFFDDTLRMLEKIYKERFTDGKVRYIYKIASDDMILQNLFDGYQAEFDKRNDYGVESR